MRIGSLFSGIGGLELGLEWALGVETAWQVERDPLCRSVLGKWWPDVERFESVEGCGRANLSPVWLICGGFPCQDTSAAGKGAGLSGSRSGLWFEMERIVGELLPDWVVVENPTSGAARWVDAVRGGLERLGYSSLPITIAASDCGARHRRSRVFIVANLDGSAEGHEHAERDAGSGRRRLATNAHSAGLRLERRRRERSSRSEAAKLARDAARSAAWPWSESGLDALVHGIPGRLAERERIALGNSCTPQQAEVVGWVIRELSEAA